MVGTAGFKRTAAAAALVGVSMFLASSHTSAGIINIPDAAFTLVASPGLITFSEFPLGTFNPAYAPATYGGGTGTPSVTFDGFFTGQSLGTAASCPGVSPLTACVIGSPTGPSLSLAAAAPDTQIVNDNFIIRPTTPVLSGTPTSPGGFNGPIAMLFSTDVAGVGFDAGIFDSVGSTKITAYSRTGAELGSVLNGVGFINFFGLETDNAVGIAGVLISVVANEPGGFGIDNVRFIVPAAVRVPEPASLALLAIGLLGIGALRRKSA